jgi:ribosome-associated toxin RatA of RatAB toxin-antitoxin module
MSPEAPASAAAPDMMELLGRGPLVLVESNAQGRFESATAIVLIERSAEEIWRVATDFASHKSFMPKLVVSTPKSLGPNRFEVKFEVDIPFPGRNERYTFRFDLEPEKLLIHGRWADGDLRDSFTEWRIVPQGPTRALLFLTNATRNFSKIVAAIEDAQQTVTVGVNVSSALAVVKAVKQRVER